jgi:hypothetical protein
MAPWVGEYHPLLLLCNCSRLAAVAELVEYLVRVYPQGEQNQPCSVLAGEPSRSAPGVDPNVVVVAVGGKEECPGIASELHLQPQHAGVEVLCGVELGDSQVEMPYAGAFGEDGKWSGSTGEEALHIQRTRCHQELTIAALPGVAGTVGVELDAVAIGIA